MKQYFIIKNKDIYYEKYWSKFITVVLRRTIDMIELEIRERERGTNARLAQLKKELNNEKEEANNRLFNKLRSEIIAAKAAAANASNSNNNAIAALIQTMSEQPNSSRTNTGATAGPAEANPSRNNESSSLNNPLLGIQHLGRRNVKRNNQ